MTEFGSKIRQICQFSSNFGKNSNVCYHHSFRSNIRGILREIRDGFPRSFKFETVIITNNKTIFMAQYKFELSHILDKVPYFTMKVPYVAGCKLNIFSTKLKNDIKILMLIHRCSKQMLIICFTFLK